MRRKVPAGAWRTLQLNRLDDYDMTVILQTGALAGVTEMHQSEYMRETRGVHEAP